MAMKVVSVSKNTPELFPLLERAYNEIFVREFPDPDMDDSLEKILDILHGGMDNVAAVINLAVDDESPDLRPTGIAVGYYYQAEAVGMLIYNAVHPDFRSFGLGKAFVQSRIESMKELAAEDGKTLRGAFIDVKDPKKVNSPDEKMDPMLRISIFKKWGAEIIPIDYHLPPQTVDGPHDSKVLLMAYPTDGTSVTPSAAADFINAFYHAELTQNGMDPAQDKKLAGMMKELATWERELARPGAPANDPQAPRPVFAPKFI